MSLIEGKDLLAKVKGAKGLLSKKGKYLVWFFNYWNLIIKKTY
jgi:hypothetical protein